MKLIYDFEEDRATKCYYLKDDGSKEYVDFWDLKTDVNGSVQNIKSWGSQKERSRLILELKQIRLKITS